MRRRVSGARVIFVAVSFLFVCLLVGMECAEGRMRRATGSYDCMQEISLSFLFFFGPILFMLFSHQNEKVRFSSLSSRGFEAKTTETLRRPPDKLHYKPFGLDFFREMFEVVNQDHLIKLFR